MVRTGRKARGHGALKSFRTKMYLGIAAISGTGGIAGALMTKMGLK